MRKLKSLFAVIMAMAMMFAMSSVAFAATSYPNLTSYETDYAYNVSANTDSIITLKVVPATTSYAPGAFTKEQAEAIEWDAALLSDEDMTAVMRLLLRFMFLPAQPPAPTASMPRMLKAIP